MTVLSFTAQCEKMFDVAFVAVLWLFAKCSNNTLDSAL